LPRPDTKPSLTPDPLPAIYSRVEQPSIPALDAIRALSVLAVILGHLGVTGISPAHGVMAFFVLSGFLITWLLLKENEQTGETSLRSFYLRRALRIFPAFYCFWVIYIVAMWLVQSRVPWMDYLAAFFYVSNYYSAIVHPPHMAMSHTWSLGVEEQFYLLWPWVFRRFKDNPRRLTKILIGVIVAIWIYRPLLYRFHYPGYGWLFCAFDCRADHLAVGCLTAVLIKRRALPKFTRIITANVAAPFITLALLAASIWMGFKWGEPYQFQIGFMLDPVLLALLMVQWIALSGEFPWRWLNWNPVRYLGRISYSAYLYHWMVDYALNTRFASLGMGPRGLLAVIFSNLAAAASYRFVEAPFLKIKKRFERARDTAPRQATVPGA
jgi:peptidoglycan/LPS O-acetylase OafA/YrhL